MQTFESSKVREDLKKNLREPEQLTVVPVRVPRTLYQKLILVMRLIAVLLFGALMHASAAGFSQINLAEESAPLAKVLQELSSQSGLQVVYEDELLVKSKPVTVTMKNASLEDALRQVFNSQPALTYEIIDGQLIAIKNKPANILNASTSPTLFHPPIDVRGRITNHKNEPAAGVTVAVKGSKRVTATDLNGEFILRGVDNHSVLVISGVNIETREHFIDGDSNVHVTVKQKVNDLDQAVVIAYGKTTQRANTAAVTVVKGETIQSLPNRSFDKSLQGLVPGLLITNGSGQPGGALSNFVLRGIATGVEITAGQTTRNPLIVVDGIPVTHDPAQIGRNVTPVSNPLAQINPSDIENISVLKDAAAIALYGSKASNGVILITTKTGKAGKTSVSFRHQTDVASRMKGKVEVLNQQEYLELLYEAYRNLHSPDFPDDASITADLTTKFPTKADGSFYAPGNWMDAVYNNHAATVANELSVSGGNEKTTFYLNFEYTDQEGIAKKTGYDRKSLRINLEHKVAPWVKIGLNTTHSYNVQDYASTGADGYAFAVPFTIAPLNPIHQEDGDYVLNYAWGVYQSRLQANPVAAAEYNINRNTSYRGLSKIYGTITFLRHFRFTSALGTDFMLTEAKEKVDPRLSVGLREGIGRIQERNIRNANIVTTNTLSFEKAVNQHHTVSALLGQEAQVLTNKYLDITVRNLLSPGYDQINAPGATLFEYDGLTTKQTLVSYFGQGNYAYRNKYFLSASVRADGSSRFGEDRRFGTYWSTGAGWVITEEPFLDNSRVLPYIKLRGSIGAAGNSGAISRFTRYDALSVGSYLNQPALFPVDPANPDIRWEQTFTWDAGIELRLLQERVQVTADVYERKTADLVYVANLPLATGFAAYLDNIGDMENKGVELSVSADIIRSKNFRWNLNANWSTNQNKLIKANVAVASATGVLLGNEEGRNFNSFYMPVWAGVNAEDGRPMWIDSTGKRNSDYAAAKRQFVGKPQPDGFGAMTNTLEYKSFALSFQLYYQYGFQIYNTEVLMNDGADPYINQQTGALDRWQKPGDQATHPRRVLFNTDGGNNTSTRNLYDGDYIRLSNVLLSYTFAKSKIERLRLTSLRVFAQGNNLAVWSKYPGQDPGNTATQGINAFAYPSQLSFSGGIQLTL